MFDYITYFIELNKRIEELEREQAQLLKDLRDGKISPLSFDNLTRRKTIDILMDFRESVKFYAQQELKAFAIEQLKDSKFANMPTHYKVFKDYVKSLSINDLKIYTYQTEYYSEFYIQTPDFCNSSDNIAIHLYLSDDKTIDWDNISNKTTEMQTIKPKELEKLFFKRLKEKKELITDMKSKIDAFNSEWERVGYFNGKPLSELINGYL